MLYGESLELIRAHILQILDIVTESTIVHKEIKAMVILSGFCRQLCYKSAVDDLSSISSQVPYSKFNLIVSYLHVFPSP